MKFSESWLRSFVDPPLSTQELAYVLAMGGLKVESVEPVAPPFDKVVVGRVLEVARHPNADRLSLCKVDVGRGAPLAVVCGAPNVIAGMKAPVALVGARLPGVEIKQAKVRGVESNGMLCSAKELGLSQDHSGLIELPTEAPLGSDVRRVLDLDDQLVTLKLTPNRGDCLSLRGVAREVSILTGAPLKESAVPAAQVTQNDKRNIRLQEPAACPRYCGRIIRGVNAKARTPAWMMQRLERCGLRPISAIVDITNFVMLELGQPLHAFDNRAIDGDVIVRLARDGERLQLLNGQEVGLTPDILLIADERKPLALGGVMGGHASAVSDATVDVFLEAAWFNPSAVAGRARRLALSSAASILRVPPRGWSAPRSSSWTSAEERRGRSARPSRRCRSAGPFASARAAPARSSAFISPTSGSRSCSTACSCSTSARRGNSPSRHPRTASTSRSKKTLSRKSRGCTATKIFRPGRPRRSSPCSAPRSAAEIWWSSNASWWTASTSRSSTSASWTRSGSATSAATPSRSRWKTRSPPSSR